MSDIGVEWKELRPKIENFTCRMDSTNTQIDAKLKKLQEKEERQLDLQAQIDAAYNKGLKDMHEAIRLIAKDESDGGMSVFELKDAFGTRSVFDIILGFTPEEIIDKTLAWITKRKESQELHVGDEILVIDSDPGLNGRTFVIYEITDSSYYVIEPLTLYKDGFFKNAYIKNQIKKTGKHYDSIPLSKEEHE